MDLPDRMIHQSFRYCLGRMSYAVGDWCQWCRGNWQDIPENEKAIIKRELEDAFEMDDRARAEDWSYKPLGMDMDRREWETVRVLWKK